MGDRCTATCEMRVGEWVSESAGKRRAWPRAAHAAARLSE